MWICLQDQSLPSNGIQASIALRARKLRRGLGIRLIRGYIAGGICRLSPKCEVVTRLERALRTKSQSFPGIEVEEREFAMLRCLAFFLQT